MVATSPLVSSHFFRFSVAIKSIPPHFENMLRKGGAAGYGFGGGGLGSHELPRPNGSSYSGGGLGGGKKSSAARRKRLLLRLGSLGVVVLFLIVLVARSRGSGGTKGGAATTTTASLHLDGEDVPAQHMKAEDTAAAAEKR